MIVKFSDVFSDETKHCQKIPSSEYLPEGSFPIIDQGKEQVAGYSNAGEGLFTEVPAIIFGDHTRIIKYVDEPFLVGADGVKVLKCKIEDTNYKYLYYCLQAIRIPNTGYNRHFKWLKEASVPLPPLDEQRKIAAVLDKVSDLIAKRRQQLTKLDELVKARFLEMFGTVKNNVYGYPTKKLGDCAKLQGGYAFKSTDYCVSGVRLVQISNVNKDLLDWDSINFVPNQFLQRYSDFALHIGDLVLAMTRPVIKSLDSVKIAAISQQDVPSLLNQRVGRFILNKAKLNSAYLMVLCQMPDFKDYVEAMSGNSLQPNISSRQVENYLILLPPLELQKQFAVFVEQIEKTKSTISHSLEKLEILKIALMQEYFE